MEVSGITSLSSYMSWENISGLTSMESVNASIPCTLSGVTLLPSFVSGGSYEEEEVVLLSTPPSYLYTTDSSNAPANHHGEVSGHGRFLLYIYCDHHFIEIFFKCFISMMRMSPTLFIIHNQS